MKNDSIHFRLGRLLAWCAGLSLVALTAGCGGSGGAGAQGGAGSSSSASSAAAIQLMIDKTSLKADGTETGTITAVVKDASNNVVARQPVAFATTDSASSLTPGASPLVTDSGGKATATLSVGSSHVNRVVTVTATAGNITQTLNVPVTGTALTLAGVTTLAQGSSGAVLATLRNASGGVMAGVPVALASARGNGIAQTPVTTDVAGQASFTVTGAAGGQDTLTAAALGASGQWSVNVASAATVSGISITPVSSNVPINTATPFTATYAIGSTPQAGKTLTLSLTRGTFTSTGTTTASGVTDGSGRVVVNVTSPTAGTATITAVDAGDSSVAANATMQFFSGPANAAKITLSPSITSVGVNASGSTTHQSALKAVVRDASDNPVSGATVAFSAVADPSGGSISPAIATTNAAGEATSAFIAGPNATGFNGVQLRATVTSNTSVSATANLTVAQVALYVDLGTGNSIEAPNSTTYVMPWSAIVTDSARQAPQQGATVSVSLTAVRYRKGVWVFAGSWAPAALANTGVSPSGPATYCLNEDANNNNILDAGEDKNANGKLDPGSPASVSISGATAADGTAAVTITYPKSFGQWVEVTLRATISTSGTQSTSERTFVLPTLAADVQNQTTAPPNVNARVVANGQEYLVGPYGWDGTTDVNGFCTAAR